jgi:putative DNA primase/helicase
MFGKDVRYDHKRETWLVYTGHRWFPDDMAFVRSLGLEAIRSRHHAAIDAGDDRLRKHARKSESARGIRAMLDVASSLDPISDNGEGWNPEPHLLGVSNGVVDLRTGKLRDGEPEDRITMSAGVEYHPEAKCPNWDVTRQEIFEDEETIAYADRAAGYSLTGRPNADKVFFPYGPGENGKTTYEEALLDVAGDYGHALGAQALLKRNAGAHSTEVADLYGKRFVVIGEVPMEQLNEARMKHLSGGGSVTARHMRENTITFQATHTLFMDSNEFPGVDDNTHGFWRRLDVLPCPYTFVGKLKNGKLDIPENIDPERAKARDDDLSDKLREEYEGILAWWVRQAVAYHQHGLGDRPEAVKRASKEFKDQTDELAEFIERCATREQGAFSSNADVRRVYKAWCDAAGIDKQDRLRERQLGRAMAAKFRRGRNPDRTERGFLDVALTDPVLDSSLSLTNISVPV